MRIIQIAILFIFNCIYQLKHYIDLLQLLHEKKTLFKVSEELSPGSNGGLPRIDWFSIYDTDIILILQHFQ